MLKKFKTTPFYRVNFKFKIRFHKYSLLFTENQSAVHGIILEKKTSVSYKPATCERDPISVTEKRTTSIRICHF